MEYQIIKVYNNNVVLAQQGDKQVVLVSKGIGFGKKPGDTLKNDGSIEKVFYELNLLDSKTQLKSIQQVDEQASDIVKKFAKIAQDKLGSLEDGFEIVIQEHIEFAISRLKMGLEIDNPLINEIAMLYKTEYQIAALARELIKRQLNIDVGDDEQAFIALHLYAAKTRKPIKEAIKETRIYARCLKIIEEEFDMSIPLKRTVSKVFIGNLKIMIRLNQEGRPSGLSIKEYIKEHLQKPYQAAESIVEYLYEEKQIKFSTDEIAYLAIAIEHVTQSIQLNRLKQDTEKKTIPVTPSIAEIAQNYIKYVGGADNILAVDACATRLRLELKDMSAIQEKALKSLGSNAILKPFPNTVHILLGLKAEELSEKIKKIIISKEEHNV